MTGVCTMCHGAGWVLEFKVNGGPPVCLELVPCLESECTVSGQAVGVLSVNFAGLRRAVLHPDGSLVMALTN